MLVTLAATVLVVLAATRRSAAYAKFRAVYLGLYSLIAVAMFRHFEAVAPLFYYFHLVVFVHSLALIRPRMRSLGYRVFVSMPAAAMSAGTLLALPWAVLSALGFDPWLPWLPYGLALVGLAQSLTTRSEELDLVVTDGVTVDNVQRHARGTSRVDRPLELVQITDPHLGPFMSERRLRQICERAVARNPDLILLTGDFLTMESQSDPTVLGRALKPLSSLPGRVFACFGNHDHEAPETVRSALAAAGATLLVDDSAVVETEAGPVQIVGFDFVWRDRGSHMEQVCARHPRISNVLRVLLLHDPSAFAHLPHGEGDLVLSGHTHGGQVGLVSLGLAWTMLRAFVKAPDHGFWARGTDRLYVHRGTGHYGFPLRLGVPAEESLLRVHSAG
jgi:hypothetical protein